MMIFWNKGLDKVILEAVLRLAASRKHNGPEWVSTFPHPVFFLIKVRCACTGFFLSCNVWGLEVSSVKLTSSTWYHNITDDFSQQDLFGDVKTRWITICHGLHWRAMAPVSSFTMWTDHLLPIIANSLPGLIKSPCILACLWNASGKCSFPLWSSLSRPNSCGIHWGLSLLHFWQPATTASHPPKKPAHCKPIKA